MLLQTRERGALLNDFVSRGFTRADASRAISRASRTRARVTIMWAAAALGFPSASAISACENPISSRAMMVARSSGFSRRSADS